MAKIAVISLTFKANEDTGRDLLERELWEIILQSEPIMSKWAVEKVTVLEANGVSESKPFGPRSPWNRYLHELFEGPNDEAHV